jgi:hypothetical protein
MSWASKHPVEGVAEWGAPALLALAAGWAVLLAGLPLVAVAGAGVIALALGVVTMRLAGRAPIVTEASFEPVPFEDAVTEDVLLLDDPLTEIEPDSRVVQLFASPEPTPGELVIRIEDYLSDGRRAPASEARVLKAPVVEQRPVDASAALHAALANIRASLR